MDTKITLPKMDIDYSFYLENGLYELDHSGKVKNKNNLEKIATYFKREFRYDFTQYSKDEFGSGLRAFLFLDQGSINSYDDFAVGGCCFRKRTSEKNEKFWALQWVWIHPYFRNNSILSTHWEYFKREFGDFFVEGPLSKNMINFLKRKDPDKLKWFVGKGYNMFLNRKYFYKFNEKKEIVEQGQVLDCNDSQTVYECMFFDFIMGDQTCISLKPIEYFSNCVFFTTIDSRDDWWERVGKHRLPKGEA